MKITEHYDPAPVPAGRQTAKISIAVAIYNGEAYLRKCVDSLLAQTYRNIEVILVDDGSTDGCPAICDEYAAADPRVIAVHKKNGGLASGRNAGIARATGEYMAFMDGDDWADPDMYERLLSALLETDADVAVCRYRWVYADRTVDASTGRRIILEGDEALRQYIAENDDIQIQNAAWNKLYRRDLIGGPDDLRFDESRWYEDILYTTKLFARVKKCVYLDSASYNYVCDRAGSYMNRGVSDRILTDQIPIYRDRAAFLREAGWPDLADMQNYYFCKRLLIYYTQTHRSAEPPEEKRRKKAAIREAVLAERAGMKGAYACPAATRGERARMALFLRSPKLYLAASAVNDRFVIPVRQRMRAGRGREAAV